MRRNRLAEDLSTAPRPVGSPDEGEELDALRQALRRLDPGQRPVLSLHYLEGYSVEQMARILDLPAGTVKSRLHYTRNELKRILEGDRP